MKSIKSGVLLFVFTFSLFLIASAQDTKAVQEAFFNSYNFEKKGEYIKAIDEIKKVYKEDSYEINIRLAWTNYMAGLFTESTTYYQKAIQLMPMSIEARLGFALPASALGNWEQVKNQYEEILKIDPQNTTVNYRMGLIYYGKQNYLQAYKYFEKAANLYPFDYDSNLYYAWASLKLNKLREAKVLFNKILLIKPNDASAVEGLSAIK